MKDVVDTQPPFRLFASHHLGQDDDVHDMVIMVTILTVVAMVTIVTVVTMV